MDSDSCPVCFHKFSFYSKPKKCADCCSSVCSDCFKKPKGARGFDEICLRCYEKRQLRSVGREAPETLTKRLSALRNPNEPPPVVIYCENRYTSLKRGLSKEDAELVDRLAKLKQKMSDSDETPSEETIAERLERLRGAKPGRPGETPCQTTSLPKPKPETPDDLIKRLSEEVKLDEASDSKANDDMDAIAERLRNLRGGSARVVNHESEKNERTEEGSENEEEEAERLAARFVAESKLEDQAGPSVVASRFRSPAVNTLDEDVGDGGELPWCTICNEDAALRCLTCKEEGDSSLFCVSCFHELHGDDMENLAHRAVAYVPVKEEM